jgi:hypothetical protein
MIQIRYRVPVNFRPTKSELDSWRLRWINGKPLPRGVLVEAIDWQDQYRTDDSIKEELRKKKKIRTVAGVVARYAADGITMCDYDRRVVNPEQRVFRVARLIRRAVEWMEFRKTARGWHLTIKWAGCFSPMETVAIQTILGSDPYREAFNFARVQFGVNVRIRERWNLLFKEKIR